MMERSMQILLCAGLVARFLFAGEMERMQYNNPGATDDLGVGLWAWPLPLDLDGDGDLDLAVSCPDTPYNGVYFFENPGSSAKREKLPVFKAGRRMGRGVGNVQVSLIDGQSCVLSPAATYPGFKTSAFEKRIGIPGVKSNVHTNNTVRGNIWCYVDYDGDGAVDLAAGIGEMMYFGDAWDASGHWTRGPLHGCAYLMRNTGTSAQPAYAAPVLIEADGKPIDVYGDPCLCFHDYDGDGDIDLICGEFVDGFTYYENVGSRRVPRYMVRGALRTPDGAELKMDLAMITPTGIDWDGDGDWDLICGDEDGRVAFIENTGTLSANRSPVFLAPRYFRQEANELKFGVLASPCGCDWDGDGDWDLICGNSAGYIGFIENLSGPGVERPKWAEPKLLEADGQPIRVMAGPNGSIQGPVERKWGYTTVSVADWDGDGLPDILANSIWGKVIGFRNSGSREKPRLEKARPIEVEWNGEQPRLAWGWLRPEGKALLTQWRTTPVAIDWDKDGLVDLVMLDQEGYLAFFRRSLENGRRVLLPPKRIFFDESMKPLCLNAGKAGRSGRRKFCLTDWDGDGKTDILVDSTNVRFWRQVAETRGGSVFRNMGNLGQTVLAGHDTSPTTADFDNNGIPDLVVGAEDGHFYYLRNPGRGGE